MKIQTAFQLQLKKVSKYLPHLLSNFQLKEVFLFMKIHKITINFDQA